MKTIDERVDEFMADLTSSTGRDIATLLEETLIEAVDDAKREEREKHTPVIEEAIKWLFRVSSADGSGHADLSERLKEMLREAKGGGNEDEEH